MKKKDYVFNMTSLILNRVRFHSPQTSEYIDLDKVIECGVDPTLPVFYFSNNLTKIIAKCLKNAKKSENFNFVMPKYQNRAKKLNAIICDDDEVKKLNINYRSGLKFDYHSEGDYVKINGERLESTLSGYYDEGYLNKDDVIALSKQFVLSGRNVMMELANPSSKTQTYTVEINLELERGYYSFQKRSSCVVVTNLMTLEKNYFNYSTFKNKFNFSCVDGVENSSLARINLMGQVKVRAKQKVSLLFNYGPQRFNLYFQDDIHRFCKLCESKNNEIFNLKISSYDKQKEAELNRILPQKIYYNWLKGKKDEQSEIKYSLLKNKYMSVSKGKVEFGKLDDITQIKIFINGQFKSFPVIHSSNFDENFLQVNNKKINSKKLLNERDLKEKRLILIR